MTSVQGEVSALAQRWSEWPQLHDGDSGKFDYKLEAKQNSGISRDLGSSDQTENNLFYHEFVDIVGLLCVGNATVQKLRLLLFQL
ncbi:hypothetical protein V6N13_008187 [Hibiscus sabdariffa]